jgi:hypothetical protein
MFELGEYYQNNLVDVNKAKMWYLKAAELGHAQAQNNLAVIYANIDNDYQEAIKWYKIAIEQDNSWAYRNYAYCLWNGDGVEENKNEAIEFMQKAISLGNPNAENELQEMQQALANKHKIEPTESEQTVSPNELHIPEGTKSISSLKAPENCGKNWKRKIVKIYLPESLRNFQESVLDSFPNLEQIIIPKGGLQKFGNMLPTNWWRMYNDDNVRLCIDIIPKGKLFVYPYGTKNITDGSDANGHVLIPPTCTEISKKAFYFNHTIQSVTMTDNVSNIGEKAFEGCDKLEFIRLSRKITKIPKAMLHYCASLREIVIPEGVKTIEAAAFTSCAGNFIWSRQGSEKNGKRRYRIHSKPLYVRNFKFRHWRCA